MGWWGAYVGKWIRVQMAEKEKNKAIRMTSASCIFPEALLGHMKSAGATS